MDKAFVKGLKLLEALAVSEEPRGVSDLARELGFTKSNVHRLLTTLLLHGYVRQNQNDNSYEITIKLWELGNHAMARLDLLKVARPILSELARSTGESVHLAVLDDTEVVYLDKIESAHHIRAHTRVGARAPAFTMATGKAILAHLPDTYLQRFEPHFQKYTSTTRTSIAELTEDLDFVREHGYAIVPHGDWREGVAACASAILGQKGVVAGAVGVSGPDSRIKLKTLKELALQAREAARKISVSLGYDEQ